jgi:hypothetical protein
MFGRNICIHCKCYEIDSYNNILDECITRYHNTKNTTYIINRHEFENEYKIKFKKMCLCFKKKK